MVYGPQRITKHVFENAICHRCMKTVTAHSVKKTQDPNAKSGYRLEKGNDYYSYRCPECNWEITWREW